MLPWAALGCPGLTSNTWLGQRWNPLPCAVPCCLCCAVMTSIAQRLCHAATCCALSDSSVRTAPAAAQISNRQHLPALPCLPALPPLPGVQVSQMVSREFEKECVVVFDEAHNIDNVCIEALSGGWVGGWVAGLGGWVGRWLGGWLGWVGGWLAWVGEWCVAGDSPMG